ncbi:MAG: transposase, partial [Prochlorothrix sp.]
RPNGTQPGSIGAILQTFKANTTRRINRITQAQGRTLWQRNYYEHIVRHQDALQAIRAYIQQNPRSWATDQLYPKEPTPQQGRSTVDRSPTPGI